MSQGFAPRFNDPANYNGYLPPDWEERTVFTKRRDNYACVNCSTEHDPDTLEVIHEFPLENGGTNRIENLLTLCPQCSAEFTSATGDPHSQDEPAASEQKVLDKSSDVPKANDPAGPDSGIDEFRDDDDTPKEKPRRTSSNQSRNQRGRGQRRAKEPVWNGQPTADDSLYRPEAPGDSPAAERQRRQREQRRQDDILPDEQEELGWLGRTIVAGAVGTTMTGTYVLVLAAATLSFPPGWDIWPLVLGLPVVGMVIGVWWRLSTAVAVCMLAPFYLLLQPFAPPGTAQEPTVWLPLVVPTLGIAYGLVADYFEFSIRERVPRPQILD